MMDSDNEPGWIGCLAGVITLIVLAVLIMFVMRGCGPVVDDIFSYRDYIVKLSNP